MENTTITIYSTSTCGYCRMLKSYLSSKGVAYEEKLADSDPAITNELLEKSGQLGVPFTVIEQPNKESVAILGFDRVKIDETLGLA